MVTFFVAVLLLVDVLMENHQSETLLDRSRDALTFRAVKMKSIDNSGDGSCRTRIAFA
jgi:hypothetical protein